MYVRMERRKEGWIIAERLKTARKGGRLMDASKQASREVGNNTNLLYRLDGVVLGRVVVGEMMLLDKGHRV